MNENLVQLFEAYKNTTYYNQHSPELSLKWLENKLNSSELEELERQIYYVMLENEEVLFINTLKFIWQTTKELSALDT